MKAMKKLLLTTGLPLCLLCAQPLLAYYDPGAQRWLNRDPKHDVGFRLAASKRDNGQRADVDPFGFVRNHALNGYDPFGLEQVKEGDIDDCFANCADARKTRGLNHVKKTTGHRVLGYIVFSGIAVTGGLLTATEAGAPVGIPVLAIGVIGDVVEWSINTRNDNKFDRQNKSDFDTCCAGCGLKYNDIKVAQKYIDENP